MTTGRRRSRVSNAPEVFGELPMTCLAEEIETPGEGQVRALLTVGSNPVLSAPNGPRLVAALETLEFMVSVDVYVNETTRHADVILPGLLPFEESHYDVAFSQLSYRNHARYSAPVLAPSPGRPAEWEILLRLAAVAEGRGAGADVQTLDDEMVAEDLRRRTGAQAASAQVNTLLQAVAQWRGPERLLDLALRGGPYGDQFGRRPDGLTLAKVKAAAHGIDLGPLAPRVPEVLRTPSGKIELAPPLFLDDLKHAEADLAVPAPDLVVIGRRDLRSNNSWMHNLPLLAKGPRRCTALVHPFDAVRCGVTDAGSARLIGASGHAVTVEVKVSDEVMPGVISLPHGWGHDLPGIHLEVAARRPGANLNALLDENLRDPLSGNAVLSGVPVRLAPETPDQERM